MSLKYIASDEFAIRFVMPFLGWTAAFGAQALMFVFFVWAISRVIAQDSPYEVASMLMVIVVMAPVWAWLSVCLLVHRNSSHQRTVREYR